MFKSSTFKLIFVSTLILLHVVSKGGVTPYNSPRIETVPSPFTPVPIGATATANTPLPYSDPSFRDVSMSDMITLGVNHDFPMYVSTTGAVSVMLKIDTYDAASVMSTGYQTLTLNYQPFPVNGLPYVDKTVFTFKDAYKFTITIQSITVNGTSVSSLPNNLYIDGDILQERYYNFATPTAQIPMAAPVGIDFDCEGTLDEVKIAWSTAVGAEEYDLEWTFVNDYPTVLTDPFLPTSSLNFNFKNNSTRVTVATSPYNITLNFEHGYILYRVRAVGRNLADPTQRIVGAWSNLLESGTVNNFAQNFQVTQPHESNKNWQYSASYAEGGKKKEVISYFDGSLRNRQSVTKNNSDNRIIVGETIYDHQGRPAINVLPVPVPSLAGMCGGGVHRAPTLHFYPNFNRVDANTAYSRVDFDLDPSGTDSCNAVVKPMHRSSGASNYYSPDNAAKYDMHAFIPNAEKYPFSQVEYTPDNTGRIRRQGSVGREFQLDKHPTKYFYGAPAQAQLDRLFGSEVGDATHYKKNIAVDPNGQSSVTYLDQEGRTVATALAGGAPGNLQALPSAAAGIISNVNIDLFNKDANGKSPVNTVSIQGDAIEFGTPLLVAYTSDYTFTYNLQVDKFPDACLKSTVCFNCVYDLEIKVLDDCGRPAGSLLNGVNPTKKSIGRFTLDASNNMVFNTICATPSLYTDAETFKINLIPGNYMVSKKLTVNKAAKDFYVSSYFATTNTPVEGTYVNLNAGCIKTYTNFLNASLAKMDTTDCNVSCIACVDALKGSFATLDDARDGFVAAGKGTELDFDFLIQQCTSPCSEVSVCEANYQMMLMDVSPDGQYGEFQPRANGDPADMNLSVFNPGNLLPKNVNQTANWHYPTVTVNGSPYGVYLDENGVRTKIPVIYNKSNCPPAAGQTYCTPDVLDCGKVYYDKATGAYYTYPENLKNLSDFVANWNDNWAKSLVFFHPEYPYYQSCLDYNKKISPYVLTSDTFDTLLVRCVKFSDAVSRGLVSNTYSADMILFKNSNSPVRDPFLFDASYGTYGGSLATLIGNYRTTSTVQTMAQTAASVVLCGTYYGVAVANLPPACGNFGSTTGPNGIGTVDAVTLDKEWNTFKNFYLSEKQKLQRLRDNAYARANQGYNACIGNPDFAPAINGLFTIPFSSSPFFDIFQPCSFSRMIFYTKKKKRFNVSNDQVAPTKDENDYQLYLQTKQSPMEMNVQVLLNALAANSKLTTATIEPLQPYAEFSQDLYKVLCGGTLPATYQVHNWKQRTLVGNTLTADILLGSSTIKSTFIISPVTGSINWSNVRIITQLRYQAGPNYTFKAVAGIPNPAGSIRPYTYYDITGTTNFVLNGYTPTTSIAQRCKANRVAIELSNLWSALALNNQFAAVALSLNTTTYLPFLTTSIKNVLGTTSNNLNWTKVSATRYELYETGSTQKLVMQITGGTVTGVSLFINIKNTIAADNAFTTDGMNSSGTTLVSTISGTITLDNSGTITTVNLGACGIPDPVLCTGNEYQSGKDLLNLLRDVMLKKPFNTNPDLTKSPAFTPLLQTYVGTGTQQSTTKIDLIMLNPQNDFKEIITYNIMCKCKIKLWHKGTAAPVPAKFSDLAALYSLTPYGTPDKDNNLYSFYIPSFFIYQGDIAYNDTIWGESCIPIRKCDTLIVADTSISPIRPYVNPCVLNQLNIAKVNAENAYKSYSDSLTTLLASKYSTHCLNALETFSALYNDQEYHYSLYYYDQAGNLVKTIPPEGVTIVPVADYPKVIADRTNNRHDYFTSHTMATTYTYNSLNQLVRQSVPDNEKMPIWEYTLSNGLDSRLKITATQFVNSTKGYLTGYIDFTSPTVFTRGYLYTTDDGGISWTRMNNLVASDLKKVQMVSATNGYAVGTNGTVLKTIDGGNTWDMFSVPNIATTFNDLYFNVAYPSNGVIVGENGTVYYTTTNGTSWLVGPTGITAGSSLTAITFDGGSFYVTANLNGNGKVYKGAANAFGAGGFTIGTWAPLGAQASEILKINMVNQTKGFAIAADGNLLKTVDGGTNWLAVPVGIAGEFKDIYFLRNINTSPTPVNGVAIIDGSAGKGLIYQTSDGGLTWKQLSASDGNYYNALYPVPGTSKGYAVGSSLKRIVYEPIAKVFSLVNLPLPTATATDLKTAWFTDVNNGCVASGSSVYFTHNALAATPSWTERSFAATGLTIKKIYFGNTENSGLLLTTNGAIYKITDPGSSGLYIFTKISTATETFVDMDAAMTRVYALTRTETPNNLKFLTKAGVGAANALTTATSSPIFASSTAINFKTIEVDSVDNSLAGFLVIGGNNGLTHRAVTALSTSVTANWTSNTTKFSPLPLYDIEAAGSNTIYAVGAEGTLLQSLAGTTMLTVPTSTITQYNAIKFNKLGNTAITGVKGLIAGNAGSLVRLDISSAGFINQLPVRSITTSNLNDIALGITSPFKALVIGNDGSVISIPDIDQPFQTMSTTKPLTHFNGVCFNFASNNAMVVGDNASIYNYSNAAGAKINAIYTPGLKDVSFATPMNGYVIGRQNNIIRYTKNGGASWTAINRTLATFMNSISSYSAGKAVIVGTAGYVAKIDGIDGTTLTNSTSGSADFNDVKISGLVGYAVGASSAAIKVTISAPPALAATFGAITPVASPALPAGLTLQSLYMLRNNSFVAVGDLGIAYCYNNTGWISIPTGSSTANFKDVYMHDDRNGYAVGDAGVIYRFTSSNTDVFAYTASAPGLWAPLSLAGNNGAASPSSVNLTTINFADRYKGFIGGYSTGTPINFARVVNDEMNLFSSRFWYDALGRMVFSQNTKQYNRKTAQSGRSDYSYTFYDALGRIVEAGEKTDNIPSGTTVIPFYSVFGDYVNGKYNPYVINAQNFSLWANNGTPRREVTRTYYDDPIAGTPPAGVVQQNLRNRVSKVTYEDVNDGVETIYQHASYYSYDVHGNVKTLWQDNPSITTNSQGLKRIDYEYDLISGKVNAVRYQDGRPDAFYHYYAYDADNKIKEVYTSSYPQVANQLINQKVVEKNKLWSKDAAYTYYAHGPLARVETGEFQSQGTDYAYTLQGWLKGVNSSILNPGNDMGQDGVSPGAHSLIGKDAFGYMLNYYQGSLYYQGGDYLAIDSTKWNTAASRFEAYTASSDVMGARNDLYNGNIGAMVTTLTTPKLYSSAPNEFPAILPQATAYKYDQLNRLLNMQAYTNITTTPTVNAWQNGSTYASRYKNTFTYDANGNISTQKRYNAAGARIDELTYNYVYDPANGNRLKQNQLRYVKDLEAPATFTDDLDNQDPLIAINYKYDDIGNLIHDEQEQIDTIKWTVYGKIKKIQRTGPSVKPDLEFKYDASGNRIAKIEKPDGTAKENGGVVDNPSLWKYTYYVRDAQGNVMSTYNYSTTGGTAFKLIERNLFGSSRLGTENTVINLTTTIPAANPYSRVLGNKSFEGSNHLGNILAIYTDKKIPRDDDNNGMVDYYQPEILASNDYTPFGAPMNERQGQVVPQTVTAMTDDCSTVTNWAVGGGSITFTVSSGRLKVESITAGTGWGVMHNVPVTSGKTYLVTFDLDLGTCANKIITGSYIDGTFTSYPKGTYSSSGTYSYTFTASATGTHNISFMMSSPSTACAFYLDNVSVTAISNPIVSTGGQGKYRYGFNGKEKDDEVSGGGNDYDYGARIYNPRLGRFLSIDPLASDYPFYSPYLFAGNKPVMAVDIDGLEADKNPNVVEVPLEGINRPITLKVVSTSAGLTGMEKFKAFGIGVLKGVTAAVVVVAVAAAVVATCGVAGVVLVEAAAVVGAAYMAKEATEVITGKSLFTGKKLTQGERFDKAGQIAGGLIVGGVANKISNGVNKLVGGLLKRTPIEITPTETAIDNAETTIGEWKGPVDYSEIPGPKNPKPGAKFTPQQLEAAKQYNKEVNGGVLRSDEDGTIMDPSVQSKSGVKANMNQVEGDHIIAKNPKDPSSPRGTNSSSNLRLITKSQNLKKSNN
jgi:RHS repeat-associated protein